MRLQSFKSARAGAEETKNEIVAAGSATSTDFKADETDHVPFRWSCPALCRASTSFLLARSRYDVDGRERRQVYVVCARQTTMPGHDGGGSSVITCGSACRCLGW